MPKLFATDLEIPELCPRELLIPDKDEFLWLSVPTATGDVSPIELSWLLFTPGQTSRIDGMILREVLRHALVQGVSDIHELHTQIADQDFMGHRERTLARIALDPRRYATFNIYKTYRKDRSTGVTADGLEDYFGTFAQDYGVVKRTANS